MNLKKEDEKVAVALQYDGVNTPFVAAKGYNHLAKEIIEQVKESGGLVHQDEQLIKWLRNLDVGQDIPEELFLIIAELIAYAWFLDGKAPPGWEDVLPVEKIV